MHQIFNNEEDLKQKIISDWLAGHGFGPGDIFLEKSFSIRVGRSIRKIGQSNFARGRSDYLVKTHDGLNLMIVEVKACTERLDDNSRDQGISYARLLIEGGMAPYVILTNGLETKIYDSISRELLNGQFIPVGHNHALNGFRVCGDDIQLRAESLRMLISLSDENLLAFCKASVAFHMEILRSDDPRSGKKYIPLLHVSRTDTAEEVFERIGRSRVTFIVGKPQVGKTSFLCWLAEESLRRNQACLFYPAISLRKGILEELCDDFHWTFGGSDIVQTAQKLISFLTKAGRNLRIIIDGWNEAEIQTARVLDRECQRLSAACLNFVISFVDNSARRLLSDGANNPGFLACAANIDSAAIPLIEKAPEKLSGEVDLVVINQFSLAETARAYQLYSRHLNVTVPHEHEKSNDPYLIGSAMRMYAGSHLPITLDEPAVTEVTLTRKVERIERSLEINAAEILKQIGNELFDSGDVALESSVLRACGFPPSATLIDLWCEVGLLTVRRDGPKRWIDFYYSRERDFVISTWCRGWDSVLRDPNLAEKELVMIARSRAAMDSLRWFLQQSDSLLHLSACAKLFPQCDTKVKVLILNVISITVARGCEAIDWVPKCAELALSDADTETRVEGLRIFAMLDSDDLAEHITPDIPVIRGLLRLDSDFPLRPGAGGQIVLDALCTLHSREALGDEEESSYTEALETIIGGEDTLDRNSAAEVLGYISPGRFCEVASEYISLNLDDTLLEGILAGLDNTSSQLGERYYGTYCAGALEYLQDEPEEKMHEWNLMKERLRYILPLGGERVEFFHLLLRDLSPDDETLAKYLLELDDPNQLKFSFWRYDVLSLSPTSPVLPRR